MAAGTIGKWPSANIAQVASRFWEQASDAKELTKFYIELTGGLKTLGYCAIVDLLDKKEESLNGNPFDPTRQNATRLATSALTAAAGSLETLIALDAPVPPGVVGEEKVADPYWWEASYRAAPLAVRLADYSPSAVEQYNLAARR